VGTFREIEWAPKAEKEYASWDDKGRLRIDELIKSIWEHGPLKGAGLPERLKYDLSGWFSRRIIGEHRLVYRITGEGDGAVLQIAQCMYHYGRRWIAERL
jgi:toxin YoeB